MKIRSTSLHYMYVLWFLTLISTFHPIVDPMILLYSIYTITNLLNTHITYLIMPLLILTNTYIPNIFNSIIELLNTYIPDSFDIVNWSYYWSINIYIVKSFDVQVIKTWSLITDSLNTYIPDSFDIFNPIIDPLAGSQTVTDIIPIILLLSQYGVFICLKIGVIVKQYNVFPWNIEAIKSHTYISYKVRLFVFYIMKICSKYLNPVFNMS